MNAHLWAANTPARFWRCHPDPPDEVWTQAVAAALPVLAMPDAPVDIPALLAWVLGEGQFGPEHWKLSTAKRIYYHVKPILPRAFTRRMRQAYNVSAQKSFALDWPTDDRYARFLWAVMAHVLHILGGETLPFVQFWPNGKQLALVLTHDIETEQGQEFVRAVANLETTYGFRSSFNFVPQRYRLDIDLIDDLRTRGFEIGVHGLKHDGLLFDSPRVFDRRATRINMYMKQLDAVGFRSPLTLRHPVWMQNLTVDYDLSFFDTDPFEPISGGTLSLWPFMLGHFVELPYTLVQDYTLTALLGETTPRIWLDKVDLIARYHGMALVNTHPDYLRDTTSWTIYEDFLRTLQKRTDYWHALPREVSAWWRTRTNGSELPDNAHFGYIRQNGETLEIGPK